MQSHEGIDQTTRALREHLLTPSLACAFVMTFDFISDLMWCRAINYPDLGHCIDVAVHAASAHVGIDVCINIDLGAVIGMQD